MLTWMHDNTKLVYHVTLWNTQSQHYNNENSDNDDNVMCASMWFDLRWIIKCQN